MGQEDNGKNGLVEGMTTNPHSSAATILSSERMIEKKKKEKTYKPIGKEMVQKFHPLSVWDMEGSGEEVGGTVCAR